MKLLAKIFLSILFLIVAFKIAPPVSADLIIPDCKWNETKATCVREYRKGNVVIPSDECLKYKNNSKFYFLWEYGNISDIKTINNAFCRKGTFLELMDKYKYFVGAPLLITIMLELIVFIISGYRKIKEILNIILVNALSLPIGYLSFPIISNVISTPVRLFLTEIIKSFYSNLSSYRTEGVLVMILTLLIIEIAVVIFETLFLIYVSKFGNKKRVLIAVIISNIVSLVLGAGILVFANSFLKLAMF